MRMDTDLVEKEPMPEIPSKPTIPKPKVGAGKLPPEILKGCIAKGYKMRPHPFCVLKFQVEQDLSKEEAEKKCVEAQKFHGISSLMCRAIVKGIIEPPS